MCRGACLRICWSKSTILPRCVSSLSDSVGKVFQARLRKPTCFGAKIGVSEKHLLMTSVNELMDYAAMSYRCNSSDCVYKQMRAYDYWVRVAITYDTPGSSFTSVQALSV